MKIVYFLFGTMSLSFGVVGVILPVIPTTPFLLLSTYLYSKSSKRINDWFINTRLYKKYLEDFIENKTMSKKYKWSLLITVDIILLISFIQLNMLFVRILIILLFLIKHWYFYTYVKIK